MLQIDVAEEESLKDVGIRFASEISFFDIVVTYVNDLPQEAEDQVLRALHHGVRVHVHHGASDGLKTRNVMQSLAERVPVCLAEAREKCHATF